MQSGEFRLKGRPSRCNNVQALMTKGAKLRLGIQSVEVATKLIRALVKAGRPVPLKELAALAGMPAGKVHRYLVSLVRVELFAQDTISGHYGFGPLSITMGLSAMRGIDVIHAASEPLIELRDEIDETVMLIIWTKQGPMIYRFEESSRPVFMNVRIGSTLPLLNTAAGRIFLAYQPRKLVWPLVRSELEAPAPSVMHLTESSISELIEETKHHGLASVSGDLLPGISALAAPVFDYRLRIVAVIGALGRSEELNIEFDAPTAKSIRRVANEISRRLGHEPE